MDEDSRELEVARLQARVEALEAALEQRSRELRLIQRHCCARDLELINRIRTGLSPTGSHAFAPELWQESTDLEPAEVAPVLDELWRHLAPMNEPDDAG